MAVLDVNQEGLRVGLGPVERVCTRHGGGVHAARDQIAGVSVVTDPWAALFRLRQRGIGLPGLLVLGVWSQPCDGLCCDLVLLRGRGPAVLIELHGHSFARLLVSTEQPSEVVAALRESPTAN